ncbi:hypothetical protein [Pleionea litopenaei]|uniref:Uncharacterized protein n=1 Tax=Pleionea litopenaei TaxID=3070815 RepID=A0AA51RRC0_9GAMM|nr:hypothetical protein [Pleionea sp. HL-JVS1]WMS86044.1 hypothetical protein Q9312_12530 [Pleionea sp. HL-JVS1]
MKRFVLVLGLILFFVIFLEPLISVNDDGSKPDSSAKNNQLVTLVSNEGSTTSNKKDSHINVRVSLDDISRSGEEISTCKEVFEYNLQEISQYFSELESIGLFRYQDNPERRPIYLDYSIKDLTLMAPSDVDAEYFAGIKILYSAFGLEVHDIHELPIATVVNDSVTLLDWREISPQSNAIKELSFDSNLFDKGQSLLLSSARKGKIWAFQYMIRGIDLRMAYRQAHENLANSEVIAWKNERFSYYSIIDSAFQGQFGTLDFTSDKLENYSKEFSLDTQRYLQSFKEKLAENGFVWIEYDNLDERLDDSCDSF